MALTTIATNLLKEVVQVFNVVPATSYRRQKQPQKIVQCLLHYIVHNIATHTQFDVLNPSLLVPWLEVQSKVPGLSPHL